MKQGQRSRFTIYNASAGSGKTYTLVKKYLAALFAAPRDDHYTHMLAITFTNRAVAEMKQRIVSTLYEFSRPEILKGPSPLFTELLEETATSAQKLHEKAQRVLTGLLHNYSAFNVETIDSFNHRIIRTFARDLKLPQNFEVSLEQYELLTKAVGQLVARAGTQPEITKVLVNFALSKTDEDKSWDIARDITAASKIIFDETETEHLAKLSGKSLQDFTDFKSQLYKKAAALKKEIVRSANEVLGALTKKAVPLGVFSRGALPKHFQKLSASIFDVYTNTLQQHLETGGNKLYVKTTPPAVAQCIDALTPFLLERYIAIKRNVFKHKLLDNVLKNLTPLSVINLVQREIEIIKEDENILPISEFNTLINNELKQQPVPFIYERLGEKYHHFFIDEFQDTSAMQWQNLLPLIDNALAQQHAPNVLGSLLLVGDAKQSIYRWRGGLPEQFMGLYGGARPFPAVAQTVEDLSTNWRSYDQIVNFNNGFFSFLSSQFQNAVHSQLYQMGSAQKPNAKKGGHVQLQFITSGNKEAAHQMYAETVLETIHTLKQKGFALAEMCVITRTRKDGTVLANALLGAGVNITSS
ncbi:MAG: UvrD-helicase domain-containing protein, partial [Marinirhabdus sp.]